MIKVKVFFFSKYRMANKQTSQKVDAPKLCFREHKSRLITTGFWPLLLLWSQSNYYPAVASSSAVNCLLLTCELYILQHFIVEFPLSVGILKKESFSDLCSPKYITCCSERLRIHFTALSYRQNCKTRQVTGIVFS